MMSSLSPPGIENGCCLGSTLLILVVMRKQLVVRRQVDLFQWCRSYLHQSNQLRRFSNLLLTRLVLIRGLLYQRLMARPSELEFFATMRS
jgi:hypothetical protein